MIKNKIKQAGKENYIKFLGTAGARFVMIKQLRASGGIWLSHKGTNLLIDPGPGSIVKCASSKPKLDPTNLDGIILTHRHLDHANDINVMIEAMTEGGFKKKGVVFVPSDALDADPVIFSHA
ncbi:MAG: MBL fold metallo-hydrolase, partial [Candidatus Omnitrophota bacterium]